MHFFFIFIFLQIVYDNGFVSARKSPCAVPFGSDTSLKSELGYQCLIGRVIDHYGQFQNGRRKIHVFCRNVLLNMVFLNFASQARFECVVLHFIVRSSIYKCWNVIYLIQDGCQKGWRKFLKFHIFLQISQKHMFHHVRNPHDRCNLLQKQPLSENHMICN